jgi:hypothetical protein
VETLVQRLADFAATPFAPRDDAVCADAERPRSRCSATAQWMLWVTLLVLPGSFLLLPLLLWAKRRVQQRAAPAEPVSVRQVDLQLLAQDAPDVGN